MKLQIKNKSPVTGITGLPKLNLMKGLHAWRLKIGIKYKKPNGILPLG